MKREIKFRFWDKEKREMNTIQGELNPLGELESNCIPMQYTGLKDKNGKEIYEGDIVKFTVISRGKNEPEYRGRVGVVSIKPDYTDLGGWKIGWCKDFEVIGNVWENPDLLPKHPSKV